MAGNGLAVGTRPLTHPVRAPHRELPRRGRNGRLRVPRPARRAVTVQTGNPGPVTRPVVLICWASPAPIWVTIDSTCAITNRQKRFPTYPACLECRRRADHGLPHAPRGSVRRPGPVDITAYVHCGL